MDNSHNYKLIINHEKELSDVFFCGTDKGLNNFWSQISLLIIMTALEKEPHTVIDQSEV